MNEKKYLMFIFVFSLTAITYATVSATGLSERGISER